MISQIYLLLWSIGGRVTVLFIQNNLLLTGIDEGLKCCSELFPSPLLIFHLSVMQHNYFQNGYQDCDFYDDHKVH